MKVIVISIGGSVIAPGKIDYEFLLKLKHTITKLSRRNKIVICTGGGKVARDYIFALKQAKFSKIRQDLIGIEATRLNAKLVSIFLDANKIIPDSLEEVVRLVRKHKIVVCGGLKPGRTSDGTTAEIAARLNAHFLVNVTNVKGLYDKDPQKFKNAKFIPEISHEEFAKILAKIKVGIVKDMREFENYLAGKKFVGTVIS